MNPLSAIDPKLAVKFYINKNALGKFLGSYQSLFKGQGIDYDEIRPYSPGDDPKAFVWAKLAQLGEPYVKTYLEERDLSVSVALDISGSMIYRRDSKAIAALRAASVLIYSAALSRDRIGLSLFSDHLERFVPPRRGMTHAGTLIQILGSLKPSNAKTNLKTSLREIGARGGAKKGVLFIISDFISSDIDWDNELTLLSAHNDVILIRIFDSFEEDMKAPGWMVMEDPEFPTSQVVHFDSSFGEKTISLAEEEYKSLVTKATHYRVSLCDLRTTLDPIQVLRDFFDRRCVILRRGRGI